MSVGVRRGAVPGGSDSDGVIALPRRNTAAKDGAMFAGAGGMLARVAGGVLLGVAAYLLQFVLYKTSGDIAYVLVVPFVGLSAWKMGGRRGLITAFIALFLLTIFPLVRDGESISERRHVIPIVSTAGVSIATAVVVEWLRRAERRLLGLIRARDALLDERTALLRAVLASEERWQVLTDAVPALITQLTPDGEIIYCNRQMLDYSGKTLDQFRTGGWLHVVHPDDADEARRRWNDAVIAGVRTEFQERVRRQDGSYRRQLVIAEPLRESTGEITSWLNALIDIEDLKRVEDALSASEQQYRLLSEAMPALVALVDLEGNRHYRNQAFYEYTGLTDAEALDWWDRGLIFQEDMFAIAEQWQETTARGETATAELRVRRHDGAFRWHLVRAVPLGSLARWLLVATDIDDRKTAEGKVLDALALKETAVAQHRHAEEQLTLLVEASSGLIESLELEDMVPSILRMSMKFIVADAYALWSLNDEKDRWRVLASEGLSSDYLAVGATIPITDVTPGMKGALTVEDVSRSPILEDRLAGYEREGIRSLFVLPLAVGGENTGTLTFYYRAPHTFGESEMRIGTALANLTASALGLARLNRGEREIREGLERANDQLATLAEELSEANAVKDEFLGMVSHELKTPITMILGGSEVLSKYGDLVSAEDRAAALADINESAKRLGQLIDNLLLLSRLEAGTLIELEPILVRHEIERIVGDYRKREPERRFNISIEQQISPVSADPTNFQQVLQNLLSNAVKYSPERTPIDVTTKREGEELIVSVLDRGRGITPEELERIFEPFYRSKRTSHGTAGAGVGLAVCRRLIEAQGGRIWAHARDGGGSVFSIALPIDLHVD